MYRLLAGLLEQRLPSDLLLFLKTAGKESEKYGRPLFLVGGLVRDLLLGKPNLDIDLVVEGSAIDLARKLSALFQGQMIFHTRFNTAKIKMEHWSVDIASAREESYIKPGALPSVRLGSDIQKDLSRRDFSINAMAVSLSTPDFGRLIDPLNGQADLSAGLIRVLHSESFKDDATRVLRAIRYEQRLGFKIEKHTLELLRRDLGFLDSISADRLRNELELCMKEDQPEKIFNRASQLAVFSTLLPAAEFNPNLVSNLALARTWLQPSLPSLELYLSILFYDLNLDELDKLIKRFNFKKSVVNILHESLDLHINLKQLEHPSLTDGELYLTLNNYSQTAVLANLFCSQDKPAAGRIEKYLSDLKNSRIFLKGRDLIEAKLASGPGVGELLEKIKAARLNGQLKTREDELEMAKKLSRGE